LPSCVLWEGGVSTKGYGITRINGRQTRVHQLAYLMSKGPIPLGFVVHHTCNNKLCINPKHLELVSTEEHIKIHPPNQYKYATHCIHGHEFTPINTLYSGRQRYCKECKRKRSRAYHEKRSQICAQAR